MVVCAGLMLWCAGLATSAEPDAKARPETILRSAVDSRGKLVSGEFTGEGQFVSKRLGKVVPIRKWKLASAFDHGRQLLRYDDELDLEVSRQLVTYRQKFARTSDQFAYWSDLGSQEGAPLNLYKADSKLPDLLTFTDVRAVGIAFLSPFEERQSLEQAGKLLLERPMTIGETSKDGLVRLDRRWQPDGEADEFYRATWIDTKNGHTIQRMEQFSQPFPNDLPSDPKRWGEAGLWAKFTWVDRKGVRCPASVRIEDSAEAFDLAFTWKSVNEELPADKFSEAEFGLDASTPVRDRREGGARLLGSLADYLKRRPAP